MPKFNCAFAVDIACFADFSVEAKSWKAAHRLIHQALKQGKFENVPTDVCWENGSQNPRVFVMHRVKRGETAHDPMETLEAFDLKNQPATPPSSTPP